MVWERKKPKTVKEIFPIVNGIFGHMNYTFREEVTKGTLDLMFVSNYGNKNPSPIVEIVLDEEDELTSAQLTTLAAAALEMYKPKWDKLAEIYDIEYDPIHNYLDEWEDSTDQDTTLATSTDGTETTAYGKVDTLSSTRTDNLKEERDVTESKSGTRTDNLTELETRNLGSSTSRTDNLQETVTHGKTSTRTDNLSEVVDEDTTGSNTGSQDTGVYGFNSAAAVGSDETDTSDTSSGTRDVTTTNTGTQATAESGTTGTANTGTQSTTGTDTGTVTTANTGTQQNSQSGTVSEVVENTGTRGLSQTDTLSGRDTVTVDRDISETGTLDRSREGRHFGNIGNLTSQKQILEEINLWRWNYMQEILNDVKEFCCLPVYLNPYNP